jgi:hypothetical protein
MLDLALGWTQIQPAVGTTPRRDIRLDPVQFGLGLVYRF